MTTIQSFSGKYISLTEPWLNDFNVEDIAHALAHTCRFAGHTRHFYSVAQHSVLVSRVNPDIMPVEKLFHDAAEAFLGDITTPLKSLLPEYCKIEETMMSAIANWLGLPSDFHKSVAVKQADMELLLAEKRDLMTGSCFDGCVWDMESVRNNRHPLIEAWSPAKAKNKFIERFDEIYA